MTVLKELMPLADRYGLPLLFLLGLVVLSIWGIRAVWKFSKPLFEKLANAVMALIEKQSDFVDTVSAHQSELKALVETGHGGHQRTHEKLVEVHSDVKAVRILIEREHEGLN